MLERLEFIQLLGGLVTIIKKLFCPGLNRHSDILNKRLHRVQATQQISIIDTNGFSMLWGRSHHIIVSPLVLLCHLLEEVLKTGLVLEGLNMLVNLSKIGLVHPRIHTSSVADFLIIFDVKVRIGIGVLTLRRTRGRTRRRIWLIPSKNLMTWEVNPVTEAMTVA